MANNLQSLRYSSDPIKLEVLDQLLIPHVKEYIDIPDVEAAWSVIRSMQIRGNKSEALDVGWAGAGAS